jgi:hypothetical protein
VARLTGSHRELFLLARVPGSASFFILVVLEAVTWLSFQVLINVVKGSTKDGLIYGRLVLFETGGAGVDPV